MIERSALPSISHVLAEMGINPNRHGRTKCPIHQGENRQAFSYNDDKGVWYCFRCGFGGDAIDLVKRSLDLDFVGAIGWLGLTPDFIKAPDPAIVRRHRIRAGLKQWARDTAKELRYEHYIRMRVEIAAKRRLKQDPEDEWGWNWLQWVYTGLDALVHKLEMLEGAEEQRIEMYKHMRTAE